MNMNRRGFFGAIAAALGSRKLLGRLRDADAWVRDPMRCAWHNAGLTITDLQLAQLPPQRTYPVWQYSQGLEFGVVRATCADCGMKVTAEEAWAHSCKVQPLMEGRW